MCGVRGARGGATRTNSTTQKALLVARSLALSRAAAAAAATANDRSDRASSWPKG